MQKSLEGAESQFMQYTPEGKAHVCGRTGPAAWCSGTRVVSTVSQQVLGLLAVRGGGKEEGRQSWPSRSALQPQALGTLEVYTEFRRTEGRNDERGRGVTGTRIP